MDLDLLFAVHINTDAQRGEFINELLPGVNLFPSSYFDKDENVARLSIYFEVKHKAEEALKIVRASLKDWESYCDVDFNSVEVKYAEVKKEDWSEKWKEFFHVEKISERLVIKPSWEEYKAEANEVVVEIDPGMCFGTGNHGTTKGCLQLLDKLSIDINDSFLDMGCGSGILSIAASKLGIKKIVGFDYDEDSVRIANDNLKLTNCQNVTLTLENLYDLDIQEQYSLVIANILAPVLIDNAPKIVSALKKSDNSRLILSGILHEQFSKILQTFESEDLRLLEQIKIDKWSTGLFKIDNT